MNERRTGPIVVGVDGSEQSLAAAKVAAGEAALHDVELHVVHCIDITPAVLHLPDENIDTKEIANREHARVHEKVRASLGELNYLSVGLEGYPPDQLVDYANQVEAQILVVGSRGRGRITGAVLGSTSLRCLERAECPVLIVK